MRPVPEFDPRAWLLKALRETAHAMEALVWEADESVLEHGDVDEWSVRDLAAHMAAMEQQYVERLEAIVSHNEPRIKAFDADSVEKLDDWRELSPFDLLDGFASQRQRSVYLLWSLDDVDWERRGIHPYLGPLTVQQCAREMNEHDLAHLWQLRRLCDRFATATV
jgi:hypothetical protein